jgi:putative oxidoreductase
MRYTLFENQKDAGILVARILMMVLFVMFGWSKLTGFSGTVAYMTSAGAPIPELSAIIAVVMEFVVGIALVVGFYTRPLALLLGIYTLATAIIGHHYWNMTGAEQYVNMINFYKNVSIMGGLFLLSITGPGKYSLDRR